MAQFYSPKSQALFPDILWLPQKGAQAGPTGRPPNAYALLAGGSSILVDAAFSWNVPGIASLVDAGQPPSVLVLTHAHVVEQADALADICRTYNVPALLHPDDTATPAAKRVSLEFLDPRRHGALATARLEVIEMPYHTPGSIMLLAHTHEGVLFAGDSAAAPGPLQEPEPPRLERPVLEGEDDDFRTAWATVFEEENFTSVLPLHGTPYVRRMDMSALQKPLIEGEPMDPQATTGEAQPPKELTASGVAAR